MKKIVSYLLVLTMLTVLIACGDKIENQPSDVTTTIHEENPLEEFFEITWLTSNNLDYQDGRWDELELEGLFNIDLQVWQMNSLDKEAMTTMLAAGTIADYNYIPGSPREPDVLYKDGLIRSVPLEMIKNYIPGMYGLLESMPIGFKYNVVDGTTDEYLGITHIGFGSAQYFYDATAVNLDWLESVGYGLDESELKPVKILVPGYENWSKQIFFTDGSFTFEDMNYILKAFTEDDPDENGEDDTFGMLYINEVQETNMTQEGLFGFVYHPSYLYKDPVTGNVVPKTAYTPYKDYLQWIFESLSKGYMQGLPGEQSWSTEWKALTQTNKMGIMQIHRDAYLTADSSMPPSNVLRNTDPNARFVIGPMFSGPEGKKVDMTYTPDAFSIGKWAVDMFGIQVSDQKLERILRMLQYIIYTDEDTFLRYHIGIEGIHWKWSGEPYMSTQLKTPQSELEEKYRGNTMVFTGWLMVWPLAEIQAYNAVNNGYWSLPAYMYVNNLYEKYAVVPEKFLSRAYMGAELHDKYIALNTELSPQMNPIISDFKKRALNGEIANFNTEWVQYIEQLYAAGRFFEKGY